MKFKFSDVVNVCLIFTLGAATAFFSNMFGVVLALILVICATAAWNAIVDLWILPKEE